MKRKIYLLVAIPLLWSQALFAQVIKELSVEKIMRDPAWIGHSPDRFYWGENGDYLYFNWNPENNPGDSLYRYSVASEAIAKVDHATEMKLPSSRGAYNQDNTIMLYTRDGDIIWHDLKTDKTKQITHTNQNIQNPRFNKAEDKILYEMKNDLYAWDLESGHLEQLIDFESGSEPKEKEKKKSEQEQWLMDDQLGMMQILKERKEKEELEESYRQQTKQEPSIPTVYTQHKSVIDVTLSPDERFVVYRLYVRADGGERTIVPDYVTESGFTEDLNARSKVGGEQGYIELGIFDFETGENKLVETKDIEGIDQVPTYWKDYPEREEEDYEARKLIFQSPIWSEDGKYTVVEARASDNKDRWLFTLDLPTAELSLIDRQRDEAWIAGPGVGYAWGGSTVGFLDNKTLYYQSEATGYSHLYSVDLSKGKKKQLTKGDFEVYDVNLSADQSEFYFLANPDHPGVRNLYTVPVKGGKMTQLTNDEGGMEYALSPDESLIALRKSTATRPWELYIMENAAEAEAQQITESITEEFTSYNWRTPDYITFTAEDGAEVHARLYKAKGGTEGKPAVVFVHGAGYLQNAHKWWSSYFREYMFHNLLADNGYTVLDIDYRGSAGYGRDWRTGIYRHMGGKDLSDQIDGARYLVEELGVDAKNLGIYGGSYGGFITLMAMFNEPETFASGAALRSVTDWAHYNHGYTSNILNTPVEDPIAYRRSSPIYFAEGLQGNLLICHGMIDTNVHFQDVVRLSQRLIELGKDDWEMAVFPVEGHGFVEPSSWTDEYKRIFKLFEDTLK